MLLHLVLLQPQHRLQSENQRGRRIEQFNRPFGVSSAMQHAPDEAVIAARVALASGATSTGGTAAELISTPAAAMLMDLTEATLRNYAWLNSLSVEERTKRKLQEPPAGLPVPIRKSGRLMWSVGAVMAFVDQKSKPQPPCLT